MPPAGPGGELGRWTIFAVFWAQKASDERNFTKKLDKLTLSQPIPLRLYTLPYWSNPPFLIFDIHSGALALSPERQSARMSKIKNGWLDQYGTESFEQQQFGTAGAEGVNGLKWV